MTRRRPISIRALAACAVLLTAAMATPAGAHGDIQASDPSRGASVPRAPRSVSITFTEAPTPQAVLEVRDGCRREVTQTVEVVDATATARVVTGQPGRWRVSYRVISAQDGHRTQGGYAFTVAGRRDCTPDEATPPPEDATLPPEGRGDEGAGSSAPVIPIALGAVAVVVLALLVRRSGSE